MFRKGDNIMIISNNYSVINKSNQFNRELFNSSKFGKDNKQTINTTSAELSISKKSLIHASNISSDNLQNGISYSQVASGSLEKINTLLLRIKELASKAAKDDNSSSDKIAINCEIQLLKNQTQNIFQNTEYNSTPIWNTNDSGQYNSQNVKLVSQGIVASSLSSISHENSQIVIKDSGDLTEDNLEIEYYNLNNKILGLDEMDTLTDASSKEALNKVDNAIQLVNSERDVFEKYIDEFSNLLLQ